MPERNRTVRRPPHTGPRRIARLVPILALAAFAVASPCPAADYSLYFTRDLDQGVPGDPIEGYFACSDTVYAVLDVHRPVPGQHRFLAEWIDPNGRIRESARFDFAAAGEPTRVWSWLRMHAAPGSSLGRLIDPSMGMQEFIGDWSVRIRIDGRKVAESEFSVLC